MDRLSTILLKRKTPKKNRHLKHEWMAFAYKTWKDYSGNKKELPNTIRFFKKYQATYRAYLDIAYSFCTDYEGNIPKLKLFYWKFWELMKEKKSKEKIIEELLK